MGQVTPYLGIFIPAAGEKNFQQNFAAGMMNIDQHDHSGGPNKGVPIQSSGLADFSVTYQKLNANVVDSTTGIGTDIAPFQNRLIMLGYLRALYTVSLIPSVGLVTMNGSSAGVRNMGNSSTINWANADGVAGDPTPSIIAPVTVPNGGTGRTTVDPFKVIVGGNTTTAQFQTVDYASASANDVLTFVSTAAKPVWSSMGSLGQVITATLSLTDSQVQGLQATPIDIVSAPGANQILMPLRMVCRLNYVAGFGSAGGPILYLAYNSSSTRRIMQFASGVPRGTSTGYWRGFYTDGTDVIISPSNIVNAPLVLKSDSTITGGTGSSLDFWLQYIIMTIS